MLTCLMPAKPALSDAALEMVSRRFGVLSEPMRLRLIQALFEGEKNVTALVTATGGTQTTLTVATSTWTAGTYAGYYVLFTSGAHVGQYRKISANATNRIPIPLRSMRLSSRQTYSQTRSAFSVHEALV